MNPIDLAEVELLKMLAPVLHLKDAENHPALQAVRDKRQQDPLYSLVEWSIHSDGDQSFLGHMVRACEWPCLRVDGFTRPMEWYESTRTSFLKGNLMVPVDATQRGVWVVATLCPPLPQVIHSLRECFGCEEVHLCLTFPSSLREAWREFEERAGRG